MKKITAQLNNSNLAKGFTLIEILVVIAIIAIISVIAVALYTNVQADSRDSKRKAELEAIANVLEVNKTSAGYQPATAVLFGGGKFPGNGAQAFAIDPQGYPYCINVTAGVADSVVDATWTNTAATASCATTAPAYSKIDGLIGAGTSYKLCTRLENRGTATVFCRTNLQ